jgi:hypothetical protein
MNTDRERLNAMAADEHGSWDFSPNDTSAIAWALSQIHDRERLLYSLGHEKFRALRNYGDRWGISHLSFDGESIAEIFDAHLDRLLDTWCELLTSLEISDPITESHAG